MKENWYKLMIGSSLLMASFGFMVHSITPAMAKGGKDNFNPNPNYRMVPTNPDGSINVKLSDDQLNKIIPKNEDGSINVKIDRQSTVSVSLDELRGYPIMFFTDGSQRGLIVGSCSKSYDCD